VSDRLAVDVCVVGDEPGGLVVAGACALAGAPVALIRRPGIRHTFASELAAFVAVAQGQVAVAPDDAQQPDFRAAMAHIRLVRAHLDADGSTARLSALGIRVFEGEARFLSARSIDVGGVTIEARRFVLATGARPALPAITGLDHPAMLTTETVFGLADLPAHLAVVGGGAEAVALGQAFRRFGSAVTLFAPGALLAEEDPEMVLAVRRKLDAAGIVVHERSAVTAVEAAPGGFRISAAQAGELGSLAASHVLVATGDHADIAGLALDLAGIRASPSQVEVDAGLRTANRRVLALGRTVQPSAPDQMSTAQGQLVAGNVLLRRRIGLAGASVPRGTLTDPQIASIGMTEPSGQHRGSGLRVLRWPLSETVAGVTTGEAAGHIRLIVSDKGLILGCAIVAARAGDLMAPIALTFAKGLTAHDLAAMNLPHPAVSDVGKRAAATYLQASLSNPRIGRIIRLLRRLG
jgi:pyruvate/2-oxoglutarate dehydrogenase complex dihydrolipoamide dehydrogenase (E3) component